MEESKDRILQLDGTIALADYFHAYSDTVKIKPIAACLIVVALILFFIYFFTLIGEQKILLQLSPLFIGLPIVGIVGQLCAFMLPIGSIFRISVSQRRACTIYFVNRVMVLTS